MHIIQNAITGEITEVPLTDEEIAHGAAERIKGEREIRDKILVEEVDPIVSNTLRWNDMADAKRLECTNPLRWAELTEGKQAEWTQYRTNLLNLPAQAGFPNTVTWPTKP